MRFLLTLGVVAVIATVLIWNFGEVLLPKSMQSGAATAKLEVQALKGKYDDLMLQKEELQQKLEAIQQSVKEATDDTTVAIGRAEELEQTVQSMTTSLERCEEKNARLQRMVDVCQEPLVTQ